MSKTNVPYRVVQALIDLTQPESVILAEWVFVHSLCSCLQISWTGPV